MHGFWLGHCFLFNHGAVVNDYVICFMSKVKIFKIGTFMSFPAYLSKASVSASRYYLLNRNFSKKYKYYLHKSFSLN